MKVLVTGAFGNLGYSTLEALVANEHEITTLDILSSNTRKISKKFAKLGKLHSLWGSVTDEEIVVEAVKNQDCIIHFAGVTPPFTDTNPRIAYEINVEGTKNIVKAAMSIEKSPRIIFPSSISIYGPLHPSSEPRNAEHPIKPSDEYSRNKAEAEKAIQESDLPWIILRITAVPSLSVLKNNLSLLYNIPMDQKIEFAHTKDIGEAIAKTVSIEAINKVLLLGGGEKSQYTNREFIREMLGVLGVKMLPEEVFKNPRSKDDWYYTGWLDTKESQKLLNYQTLSFDDYLDEIKKNTRLLRFIITIFRPIVRKILICKSPYYMENKKQKK